VEGKGRRKRSITRIDAVTQHTGPFRSKLWDFKNTHGHEMWGGIFGRLLVGWLDSHAGAVSDIDMIVGNPTHAERKPLRHIEAIMAAAYTEDALERWPFAVPEKPALVKTMPTAASKSGSFSQKEEAAWEHVMAIQRSQTADFTDKKVLLIDDVCTTGLQLNYLAYRLLAFGATEVRALVLARAPWRN
jgi:predicted amidophosphoribosyltransferase